MAHLVVSVPIVSAVRHRSLERPIYKFYKYRALSPLMLSRLGHYLISVRINQTPGLKFLTASTGFVYLSNLHTNPRTLLLKYFLVAKLGLVNLFCV